MEGRLPRSIWAVDVVQRREVFSAANVRYPAEYNIAEFAQVAAASGALLMMASGSGMEQCVPMGVVDQLDRSASLDDAVRSRALAFLDDSQTMPQDGLEILNLNEAREANYISGVLLELGAENPLVLASILRADRSVVEGGV